MTIILRNTVEINHREHCRLIKKGVIDIIDLNYKFRVTLK